MVCSWAWVVKIDPTGEVSPQLSGEVYTSVIRQEYCDKTHIVAKWINSCIYITYRGTVIARSSSGGTAMNTGACKGPREILTAPMTTSIDSA